MAGVIDDIDDSFSQVLNAANLPVSIIVLKIGTLDNDTDSLKKLSSDAFKDCERTFIEVLSFENYKELSTASCQQLEYDLIKNIPK